MLLKPILLRLRNLRRDTRGLAMLEMALGLPLVLVMGGWGAELSNYAIVQQRVNQAALQLADNASRVGQLNSDLVTFNLRETDLNDVLQGTRLTGSGIKLTTYGRITLSSLEMVSHAPTYDSVAVQRIHWQRCIGMKSGTGYDSTYGSAGSSSSDPSNVTAGSDSTQANAGTAVPLGMGDTGAKVLAPNGSGVMFVEVNFLYQPLFGTLYMSPTRIHYTASFIVRDARDFDQIYNPSPASAASTCNLHNA